MNYVTRDIISGVKNQVDTGQMKIPLGCVGGITEAVLHISCTNGATNNLTNPIRGIVKKISIMLDYSHQLINLTPYDLIALATLRNKIIPDLSESTVGSAVQSMDIPLSFSRAHDDDLIALNLTNYPDACLVLDLDLATVRACGTSGFLSKSLSVTMTARTTEPGLKPSYLGMIMPALAASGKTDLGDPQVLEILAGSSAVAVYLYAYLSGTGDDVLVTRVLLSENRMTSPTDGLTFLALQRALLTLAGAVVTSWAQVAEAAGRDGDGQLQALAAGKLYLLLKSSVAAGDLRVIVEHMLKQ